MHNITFSKVIKQGVFSFTSPTIVRYGNIVCHSGMGRLGAPLSADYIKGHSWIQLQPVVGWPCL